MLPPFFVPNPRVDDMKYDVDLKSVRKIRVCLFVCCHLIRLVPRHLPLKGKAEKQRKSKASP